MKQMIISRIKSVLRGKSLLAGLMCLMLAISAPISMLGSEQRHGSEQRKEQRGERRNGEGRRHSEGRRNSGGGNERRAADRGNNGNRRPGNNNNNANHSSRPGNNNAGSSKPEYRPGHGGNSNRPGHGNHNAGSSKPEYRPGHGGNSNRPGHGNNNAGSSKPEYRPGHGDNGNRPGHGNVPGHNWRPGHGDNGNRPGHGNVPGHNWRPGHSNNVRPGAPIHRPHIAPPPMRPYRPAHFHGYHRPAPPRGWRPGPRPLFTTVLGLSFGSAINFGIDALISSGYTVDGYCDNMVYVNDAVQLNLRWPFGVLQYSSRGLLEGSEFVYDSPWYDTARYNAAYNRLYQLYGPPMDTFRHGHEFGATWWGPGGQFVTLRFDHRSPMQGPKRYFTTLSFGI